MYTCKQQNHTTTFGSAMRRISSIVAFLHFNPNMVHIQVELYDAMRLGSERTTTKNRVFVVVVVGVAQGVR